MSETKKISENIEKNSEIQTQSSISFFSILFDEEDSIFVNRSVGKISNLSLIERLESSKLVKIIYKIFGNESFGNNKEGIISKIFTLKHGFYKKSDNKILIEGLDGIEFEFIKTPLNKNYGLYKIDFIVHNVPRNISRTQKHYLQSIFFNLQSSGFNIKYIDDTFSGIKDYDPILGNSCINGKICGLLQSLKDFFIKDNKKINELLEKYRNGEGEFEDIKNEIIVLEIKKIEILKITIVNNFTDRLDLIDRNIKIDKEKKYKGNPNDIKLEKLKSNITDSKLLGVFEDLKIMNNNLHNLIDDFELQNNIHKNYEGLKTFVEKSDGFFDKISKQKGLLGIFRNFLGKKNIKPQESKQLTKQKEIDMTIDVIVEFLNDYYNGKCYKDKILFLKEKYKTNNIVQTFLFNDGVKEYEKRLEFNINDKSLYGLKYDDDSEYTDKFAGQYWLEKFRHYYKDEEVGNNVEFKDEEYIFKVKNYGELENIFGKYEYYLKQLYFQDYAFEKSLYTDDYQKILYKKGEFYFDEKVDFDDFTKSFFEKVGEKFGEKQLDKKNVWERLDFEIIEKNDKKTEDLSEINNIFDIKIGDDVFPIYIVNPIGVDFNKILTIGTYFDNNIEVLEELRKISNEINRKNLQNGIKEKIDKILVMNFDKTNMNAINKNEACKYKFFANKFSGYKFKDGKTDLETGMITIEKNDNQSKHNQYHNPSIIYEDTIVTKKHFISDLSVDRQNIGGQGSLYFDFFLDLNSGNVLNKFIVDYLVYGIKTNVLETNIKTLKKLKYGKVVEEKNFQYDKYLSFVHSYDWRY